MFSGLLSRKLRLLIGCASMSTVCSSSMMAAEKPYQCIKIGYVTDIEGNLDYWKRYLKLSRVLEVNENTGCTQLKDNCHLVFGGDVCDRGPGDLRVIDDLLALKSKYPERVHFILGNRDINKLRFKVETSDSLLGVDIFPYWVHTQDDSGVGSAASRIKYMLRSSMGAPVTFEHRRNELIELGRSHTDDDVARSFIDTCSSKGSLTEFLLHGKLGFRFQDTLFIHGGLLKSNYGILPFMHKTHRVDDVNSWIQGLNDFKNAEMRNYISQIDSYIASMPQEASSSWSCVGGYKHRQPGSRLLMYGMGWDADKSVNPSIVYSNFLDDKGQPTVLDGEVLAYCKKAGIKNIIVGHQPAGDSPLVIASDGVSVLCGDTSYANDVQWVDVDVSKYEMRPSTPPPIDSTRGVAVSEILFEFPAEQSASTVTIHGVLSNGIPYEYNLAQPLAQQVLGKEYSDSFWARALVSTIKDSEQQVVMTKKEGYGVINTVVPSTALKK